MATKTIHVDELKIGMYIILDLAWFEHPFLKNQFIISSVDEIKKIKGLGLENIQIDLARSKISSTPESHTKKKVNAEMVKSDIPVVPAELLSVIRDIHLTPEKKADLVRQHSITMMKRLMENPIAANIQSVKRATSELVERYNQKLCLGR